MNLLIKNKNTGETIHHSLDVTSCFGWSSEDTYCYNNKGYKILSIPQLYLKEQGKNRECKFISKKVIRRGDIIIIIGKKGNIEYKLSFKKEESNWSI